MRTGIVIVLLALVAYAQSPDQARLDPTKYTVYIVLKSKDDANQDRILLLNNNTKWPLRIPISNTICHPRKDSDGNIYPLYESRRPTKETVVFTTPNWCNDVVLSYEVQPGESVSFRVPVSLVTFPNTIALEFDYPWEDQKPRRGSNFGEPSHKVKYGEDPPRKR